MEILKKALEFEENVSTFKSRDERIRASHTAKELVLSLNEIYKVDKDPEIMDVVTELKELIQKNN